MYIPSAIIVEATLSFLGIGIRRPTPSWGNILAGAQNYYPSPGGTGLPGLALLITTLAFNLLGDGIRDAMDPRTERILRGGQGPASDRRGKRPARPPIPAPADRPTLAEGADMGLTRFLIRRILTGIVVLWIVATGTFFLFFTRPVEVSPGSWPAAPPPRR